MQGYEYGYMQNVQPMGFNCPYSNMAGQGLYNPVMGVQDQMNPVMGVQGQVNPVMGVQAQQNPMLTMTEQQLENMYPNVYHIVNPVVEKHCDELEMKYGKMYCPTKEQVEAITDNIVKEVEADVTAAIEKEGGQAEIQLGFGGRRLLRNLVGILLIRNLLGRRRHPFGFFPGFYPVTPFGGFYGF